MKECPYCGEEVQDGDVIFHRCSTMKEKMKENSKTSVVPFLIAGIVGSSIFALFIMYGYLISVGIIDWWALLIGSPFGLFGGFVGYLLFKLGGVVANQLFKFPKTPPKLVAFGFNVISIILGLVFYSFFYFVILVG